MVPHYDLPARPGGCQASFQLRQVGFPRLLQQASCTPGQVSMSSYNGLTINGIMSPSMVHVFGRWASCRGFTIKVVRIT